MALLQALCAVGIGTLLGTVARRSFDTDPTRSRAYAALKTAVLACSLGEVVLFAWIQGRTIDIALGAARGLGQAFAWVVFSVAGLAVLCVLLILARLRRPSGLAASRRDPPDGP
jgi:cytochrome bd-type quinol oxidase subunit 2